MSTAGSSSAAPRRIACVQLDSKHADVARNTDTVLSLVSEAIVQRKSTPIHLLVLPELALTGYVFKNREEIDPLLEDARTFESPAPLDNVATFTSACKASCLSAKQPSLTLAAHLAGKLHCHVVIGFPEVGSLPQNSEDAQASGITHPPFDARPRPVQDETVIEQADRDYAFNSAALVAPDGSLKHVFRKHFLYETDEVWASQGSGFQAIHLPLLGNVCVGICMDLNPFQFQTPFESCELTSFCRNNNVDLLVMPMAWLLPKDEQEERAKLDANEQTPAPSLSTINYWAVGNRPLLLDSLGTTEQACLVVELPA
ncbi:hypothetical protein EX895_001186 [Sporisorium graminicola]|uniref:CN hydrolase domain-containing protein n=1 Tax=Sporisorium graminicola TaxID=280036 RepID=A0A4V6EUJ4_9BASI|nr:hypothetical protein EX895_001186 [Sporisorium graminicola]TKY89889.1 hypothetical protein EX895_001186 [Sporisorium graminicola]